MFALIVLIVFGIMVAFFATQNTQQVSIVVANYQVTSIPMYFVILGAMLFGILVSFLISMVNFIASSLTIYGKNSAIKEGKRESTELARRVHQLELENEKLKGEKKVITERQ